MRQHNVGALVSEKGLESGAARNEMHTRMALTDVLPNASGRVSGVIAATSTSVAAAADVPQSAQNADRNNVRISYRAVIAVAFTVKLLRSAPKQPLYAADPLHALRSHNDLVTCNGDL